MSRPFSKFVSRSSERAFNSRPYICFGKGGARAWPSGKPESQFYCMKSEERGSHHCSEPKMSRPFSTFVRRSSERALIRDHIYVLAKAERVHGSVGSLKVNFTV